MEPWSIDSSNKEEPPSLTDPRIFHGTQSVTEAVRRLNSAEVNWQYDECYVYSKRCDAHYLLTREGHMRSSDEQGPWALSSSCARDPPSPTDPRVLTTTTSVAEAVNLLNSGINWPHAECFVYSASHEKYYLLTRDTSSDEEEIAEEIEESPEEDTDTYLGMLEQEVALHRSFRINRNLGVDSEARLVKHTAEAKEAGFACGVSAMQGRRPTMEDAHLLSEVVGPDLYLFAVFDGHGGELAAKFAAEHFAETLSSNSSLASYVESKDPDDAGRALTEACMAVDQRMRAEVPEAEDMGCTAVVLLITPTHLCCANVGDSRCVVDKAGEMIAMSIDHKPKLQGEFDRIVAAGGFVLLGRVNGALAVARALGDFGFKANTGLAAEAQAVTAAPEIYVHHRSEADNFVVLACDGIWDVVDNSKCGTLIAQGLKTEGNSVGQVCEDVIQACYDQGSGDNMSIIIIEFLYERQQEASSTGDLLLIPPPAQPRTSDCHSVCDCIPALI